MEKSAPDVEFTCGDHFLLPVTSSFAMSRCGECPASMQIGINLVVDQVQHVQVVFEMTTRAIAKEKNNPLVFGNNSRIDSVHQDHFE